jgi:hypothetical protein
MGVAYAMNNGIDVAIDYFMKSIEEFQRLDDYDDTALNWPMPNLGFIYWLHGRHEDAERVLGDFGSP